MLWNWLRQKVMRMAEMIGITGRTRRAPPPPIPDEPAHRHSSTTSESYRAAETSQNTNEEQTRTEPEPEPEKAGASDTSPQPEPPQTKRVDANRAERRRLERRRRKHDKFVIPQGELPPHDPEPKPEPKPKPKPQPKVEIITEDDPRDMEDFIHGKHHEDTEEVLYRETEMYGEFNFRDTILQQLERYFVYLARMKKHDKQSFHFYRQVGITLLPYVVTGSYDRDHEIKKHPPVPVPPLPDWFHQQRPTFGCFAYGADPETEKYEQRKQADNMVLWVPKFMYFTKYKRPPPEIQMMSGGDIYKMTVWWDRPFDKKVAHHHGAPEEFAIFISADGKEIVALKTCETKWVPVPSGHERPRSRRKGGHNPEIFRKRELGHTFVPDRAYRIPTQYEKWAKLHGTDAQHMLTGLFVEAAQKIEMAQYSMVRIAATQGDMTAVFSVNLRRMGYFFQDRDYHVNDHGTRKRIFHLVRAHERKDGTLIKFHFRGERQFTWAGYDISITVPGRDHIKIADLNIGSTDEYWIDDWKGGDWIDTEQWGKIIADEVHKGLRR